MRFLDIITKEIESGNRVIIPDIKCYSPKDGDLLMGRNPVEVACSLVEAGAKVLSVVTEEKEFKGSVDLLKQISLATGAPILRKDFIHTREDLVETLECGASTILLMCSCLTREELKYLYHQALELGLDPFVETHSREEMELAISLDARLVGINNRNILELERDDGTVATTLSVVKYASRDAVLVSESSIMNSDDVAKAMLAGADCALIGTAIWKAPDPAEFYKSLLRKVRLKICGLMKYEDVELCMRQGVDVLGFVCEYPVAVPWNLGRDRVKELISGIPKQFRSCIVTGGGVDKIIELAMEIKPDMIQLHYRESLDEITKITAILHEMGVKVIKTIPVNTEDREKVFASSSMEEIIKKLCKCGVDGILLDARDASNAGEYGLKADLSGYAMAKRVLEEYDNPPQLILAGGINPENISAIMDEVHPDYIDVMTGVEAVTGVKDEAKIIKICQAIS